MEGGRERERGGRRGMMERRGWEEERESQRKDNEGEKE